MSITLRATSVPPLSLPEVPEQLLDVWRKYLMIVRQLDFSWDEAKFEPLITATFIELRKASPNTATELLHLRLTLAR
jgi:hypothetical protein